MFERPDTRYVTTADGVSLAYHVLGDGPLDLVWTPVVSYPFDLLWDEPSFVHFARRVASFSRSLWITSRGFGGSGGSWTDNFDPATADGDFSAVLDDAGCDAVALIGFGIAGPFAVRYAHAHPERVRSLVLIDTFARYVRATDYPIGFSETGLQRFLSGLAAWGTGISAGLLAPGGAQATTRCGVVAAVQVGRGCPTSTATRRRAVLGCPRTG